MNNRIIQGLMNAEYKFAKTMVKIPHSYTLRDTWNDQEFFNECVQFIRDNGAIEFFWGKPYIYFYHNGYKYWTMGNPVEQTKLINRAYV